MEVHLGHALALGAQLLPAELMYPLAQREESAEQRVVLRSANLETPPRRVSALRGGLATPRRRVLDGLHCGQAWSEG